MPSPSPGRQLQVAAPWDRARVVIPVRNGGARWRQAAEALHRCVPAPSLIAVVDSGSTDGSDRVAADNGFELLRIEPETFNHGRTRQMAIERYCAGKELVVLLTHDAVPDDPHALDALLAAFSDPEVGAAYGRQLPHHDARPFDAHIILFNYGADGDTRSLADAPRLGIKTAYLSNSFAAYRISALQACGGFPDHLILGEDAAVAVKMLLAGWKVRYSADARVRHSHSYTIRQELQRYFDFGVMHTQLPELLQHFGVAEGEGVRFVVSELRYMAAHAPWLLPLVPIRNAAKYIGYRLGRIYRRLPAGACRRLSMTKIYWDGKRAPSAFGR